MRRDLTLVILSMIVWGIGEGMFFFFQPLYLQELGANPITIGVILGSVGVVMALVHIPAGYLADRFGRRQLLWSAWILGTLATLIMAFAPSLQFFVAGMVIYGITIFVAVPLNSYVTAARGSLTIGRVLTFSSAAFNLGAIIGPIIGGLIGQVAGLQTTFKIAALFFVISTGLILFIRKQQ